MNGKIILAIRAALLLLAVFLCFKIYRVIMEPIEFERIQTEREDVAKHRLELIRDAQKVYKGIYGTYVPNLDGLVAFVDTGMVNIEERKDSSYMAYSKIYQKDMMKDTVIRRVIGQESVRSKMNLSDEFDPMKEMYYVPFNSNNVPISLEASQIMKNRQYMPVFEAAIRNEDLFADYYKSGDYSYFLDKLKEDYLAIGSLTEVSLSGNWK